MPVGALPGWISFTTNTFITGTTNVDVGTHNFNLIVEDDNSIASLGGTKQADNLFSITITPFNSAPIWTGA